MKRIILLVICLLLVLSACSTSTERNQPAPTAAPQPESSAESEPSTSPESTEAETANFLIDYFSWGGNTRGIAEEIQRQTGTDLFEITPVTPYSDDYDTVLDEAQRDQNAQARPELQNHVEDMGQAVRAEPDGHRQTCAGRCDG